MHEVVAFCRLLFAEARDDFLVFQSEKGKQTWYVHTDGITTTVSRCNRRVNGYFELFKEENGRLTLGYCYDRDSVLGLLDLLQRRMVLDALARD